MEISPFPHQGPLEPGQVRGRDPLVADLTERLTARRVTALLGPRRFGKTSVLRRVTADMADAGASVIWVDLYEVTSVADLARRFDSGLAEATGQVRGRLDDLAVGLTFDLGFLGVDLARRSDERPDADAAFAALLDTLVAGARATPTVLVIDELPGIERVPGAAGLLRTKLQHHVQEVGLAFAGSQPSLMRTMFVDPARPFYAQADLVEIEPFTPAAVEEIVVEGFRSTGRQPGQAAPLIHRFTGGHPYRTMQAADALWRVVEPGGGPADGCWTTALDRLRDETNLANEAAFGARRGGEKAVLRLVAHGDALFGSTADLLGLSAGAAQHAREALVANGDVTATDGRLRIVDPVLADWVRNRFPR
ncbi:MAG TPA: ATP-binding protein [Iamia sp.]